jgi:magnesium-transporting ATPase (P-type)
MRQEHDDPSVRDAEAVARSLRTDVDNGLTAREAERRLAEVGRNQLRVTPPPSVWRRVLRQFQDPLVYLLLAAIAVSLSVWAIEDETGIPVASFRCASTSNARLEARKGP